MPDIKITELPALLGANTAANDVIEIVDVSTDTSSKITRDELKAGMALNNVDNTSDANKPISTAMQTALDAKQATITGAATTIDTENLTVSRALVSDVSGKVAVSDVTATELSYVDGVTSAIQTQLDGKVDENVAITGATKTKVTYDAKGLVTSGADATTADIAASTDKNYVTDAQAVVIGNTSGTNTGDNATNSQYSGLAATIATKLGFTAGATYSGSTTIVLTQAEYDAIGSKNANTIYFIV